MLRRFAAMLYDSLLILALMMLATSALLPLTGGESLTADHLGGLKLVYQLVLLGVLFGFFGWFWTHRGQTLGMTAWRLKIERHDGGRLTWTDALKRFGAACLSWLPVCLGYFWIWIDRDRLAWHDRLSDTRVVVVPKKV